MTTPVRPAIRRRGRPTRRAHPTTHPGHHAADTKATGSWSRSPPESACSWLRRGLLVDSAVVATSMTESRAPVRCAEEFEIRAALAPFLRDRNASTEARNQC